MGCVERESCQPALRASRGHGFGLSPDASAPQCAATAVRPRRPALRCARRASERGARSSEVRHSWTSERDERRAERESQGTSTTAMRLISHAAITALALMLSGTAERPALADAVWRPTAPSRPVGETERWLSMAAAVPVVASEPTASVPPTAGRPASEAVGALAVDGESFLRLSPRATVVARDWRGSVRVLGDRTLVDDVRPTASNRMIVGRIATASALSPYVQVGLGEWRIDRVLFPNAGSYSELAAQVAMGFELRLSSRLRVASEAQYTMLDKDLHYEGVAPRILAVVLAMGGRF
jgi:hypothetical protein